MNSKFRQFVKCYVEVKFEKEPNISTADMMKWLLSGNQSVSQLAPKMDNVWECLGHPKAEDDGAWAQVQLKKVITKTWREIDKDKALCKSLISSIPLLLQAVINLDGRQITKEDY